MTQDLIHIKIGSISPLYSLFFCVDSAQPFLSLVVEIVDAANKHMSNGGRDEGGDEKGGRRRREGQAQNLPNLKQGFSVLFLLKLYQDTTIYLHNMVKHDPSRARQAR